jgi:ABC-type branched-subunit amino acid transport system ATPase component
MLEIQGLDVAYGESQVLWNVSLSVPAGGVVCLMGRNGVGKTTLLKSIMGLLPVRGGRIVFDGIDLVGRRPEERTACGIGYVPQGREIFPNLTVSTTRSSTSSRSSRRCWRARVACSPAASSSSSPSLACSSPGRSFS